MKFDILDEKFTKVGDIEISEDVILKEPNEHLVYQMLMLQHTRPMRLANTKTRAEVRGGGRKPWKQKGTGRARAGSLRSPLFAGGGVIFGPRTHVNTVKMPRRARMKALCSCLSMQKDGFVFLQNMPSFSVPSTAKAVEFLGELRGKKTLIILDFHDNETVNIRKSLQNVDQIRLIDWRNLNVHDLLNAERILIQVSDLKKIEQWLLTRKIRKGVKQ